MQTPTTPPCFFKQRRAGFVITGPLVPQTPTRYSTVTTLFLKAAQGWVCYNRPTSTQTLVTLQNDHHPVSSQGWVYHNRPTSTQTLVTPQNDHHPVSSQSWVRHNRPTGTQTQVTLQNDHHPVSSQSWVYHKWPTSTQTLAMLQNDHHPVSSQSWVCHNRPTSTQTLVICYKMITTLSLVRVGFIITGPLVPQTLTTLQYYKHPVSTSSAELETNKNLKQE